MITVGAGETVKVDLKAPIGWRCNPQVLRCKCRRRSCVRGNGFMRGCAGAAEQGYTYKDDSPCDLRSAPPHGYPA
jgi:hypothetical protein